MRGGRTKADALAAVLLKADERERRAEGAEDCPADCADENHKEIRECDALIDRLHKTVAWWKEGIRK